MDFKQYVSRHKRWSAETFGAGDHTEGLLTHIEKEVKEAREAVRAVDTVNAQVKTSNIEKWKFISQKKREILMEIIDIIILAIDLAWRLGFSPDEIENALAEKQVINMKRKWPKITDPNKPTEHIKEEVHNA